MKEIRIVVFSCADQQLISDRHLRAYHAQQASYTVFVPHRGRVHCVCGPY